MIIYNIISMNFCADLQPCCDIAQEDDENYEVYINSSSLRTPPRSQLSENRIGYSRYYNTSTTSYDSRASLHKYAVKPYSPI